jgi:dihydrofolate reductase
MRRIFVSNLMSLDGFFEGPKQELDWFVIDEEFFEYARQMLRSVDAILFGRLTYQHMAAYWPTAPADEIAGKMNSLPKIVCSKSLDKVEWNNSTLIKDNITEEIAKLKQQPGKDIVILGSAELASFLLQAGLIDEYRVILNPILVGSGNPLFKGIKEKIKLRLTETKQFGSGVMVLYYQPA